jgi:hypothetical protein
VPGDPVIVTLIMGSNLTKLVCEAHTLFEKGQASVEAHSKRGGELCAHAYKRIYEDTRRLLRHISRKIAGVTFDIVMSDRMKTALASRVLNQRTRGSVSRTALQVNGQLAWGPRWWEDPKTVEYLPSTPAP